MKSTILLITLLMVVITPCVSQGVFEDFEGDLSSWNGGATYTLSLETNSGGHELRATADITQAGYQSFAFDFAAIDMSQNTTVSLVMRASKNVSVRLDVVDQNGRQSNAYAVTHNVTTTDQLFVFDFEGKFVDEYGSNPGPIDPTQIKGIRIHFNAGSTYTGTVYLDDIIVGAIADPVICLVGSGAFGPVLINDTKDIELKLINRGGSDLNTISADLSPAVFTVSNLPTSISAGNSTNFNIHFTPSAQTDFSGQIAFSSNAINGDAAASLSGSGVSEPPPGDLNGMVRVNQIGYYVGQEKLGVVVDGTEGQEFNIRSVDLETIYYTGQLSAPAYWSKSEENVSLADFTDFETPGEYVLEIYNLGRSYPFEIKNSVFHEATLASLKAYYYNRASMELDPAYAGQWARAAGHPDTEVEIHASAATDARPAGTRISSPKGWYDAGDFGKYVVNGGISVHTLLCAYEAFEPYYASLNTNIPESNNAMPDILDEVLWELEWMLTVQDPGDGGIYHKVTTANFTGSVMPAEANGQRYALKKSTVASLNFAAVMAQAARVYEPFDPVLATRFLNAAIYAYQWSKDNPIEYYNQNAVNQEFEPDVFTGEYGDYQSLADEFNWAAMELYITTQQVEYFDDINFGLTVDVPGWANTNTLGYLSLINNKDLLTADIDISGVESQLLSTAENLKSKRASSPYQTSHENFYWGSNSAAGNEGFITLFAYLLTADEAYLKTSLGAVDYMLGRNPVNYSFLTGFGSNSVMNIHHRQSQADGIEAPVPGFVAGGADGTWQQNGICPGTDFGDVPAKAFLDMECAYSMTEVTINWNAPFVFLFGAFESMDNNTRASAPPLAPSDFTAIPSENSIALNWTDNATNEEGYHVYRLSNGKYEWLATLDANEISFTTDEFSERFIIKAFNNDGISANVTVEVETLETPTQLSATALSESEIQIQWMDNSTSETDYVIERAMQENGDFVAIATLEANSTNYIDSELQPETVYYYRVKAINSTLQSSYSEKVFVSTLADEVTATAIGKEVTLYPNPVIDFLTIDLGDESGRWKSVVLRQINGQVILEKVLESQQGQIILSTSELRGGVYLLQLKGENNSRYFRILHSY
ncbi:glycoside hydrolase family 9 protein [Reichenbachiella ulvae]|uniref:Endoglucanase n=1 Tax=Reichenbachiella ulvae TaxID=2980104 RepID=A0ABT3CZ18_9BACT|nr:glycoside hydrolase family 9 protein [Reichenbachiella ulvae]MCV9388740.1 glycoside hydrolase family 9 protein [Reichenbachiella ulvae]